MLAYPFNMVLHPKFQQQKNKKKRPRGRELILR